MVPGKNFQQDPRPRIRQNLRPHKPRLHPLKFRYQVRGFQNKSRAKLFFASHCICGSTEQQLKKQRVPGWKQILKIKLEDEWSSSNSLTKDSIPSVASSS